MKKLIVILMIILLSVLIGCSSSYMDCFDDCARVKCDYSKAMTPNMNSKEIDKICPGTETTIRGYCYEECK